MLLCLMHQCTKDISSQEVSLATSVEETNSSEQTPTDTVSEQTERLFFNARIEVTDRWAAAQAASEGCGDTSPARAAAT